MAWQGKELQLRLALCVLAHGGGLGACGAGLVPARVLLAAVALRRLFLSSLGHRHVAVLAWPPGLKEFE